MNASELYRAGHLTEAVDAALGAVKKSPTDLSARRLLCELLCFAGDLERADKQLDAIGRQDPKAMTAVALFRQLIRAEVARRDFFAEGRLPEFIGRPSPVLRLHLEASICQREGEKGAAAEILARAEAQRAPVAGVCDGEPFADFRDMDDMTAPLVEVLTSTGKYFWISLDNMESIELLAPERPCDLLWRRARMSVRGGPDGEVFLPALYPNTHAADDDQLRLGRGTDWTGGEGEPVLGVGLRMFLVGEEEKTVMQLGKLEFDLEKNSE